MRARIPTDACTLHLDTLSCLERLKVQHVVEPELAIARLRVALEDAIAQKDPAVGRLRHARTSVRFGVGSQSVVLLLTATRSRSAMGTSPRRSRSSWTPGRPTASRAASSRSSRRC